MFSRRTWLKSLLAGIGFYFLGGFPKTLTAQERIDADSLKKKLAVKTKKEEAFIDRVDALRKSGALSEQQITAAYRYALKRRSERFLYFATAIRQLAKRSKVDL